MKVTITKQPRRVIESGKSHDFDHSYTRWRYCFFFNRKGKVYMRIIHVRSILSECFLRSKKWAIAIIYEWNLNFNGSSIARHGSGCNNCKIQIDFLVDADLFKLWFLLILNKELLLDVLNWVWFFYCLRSHWFFASIRFRFVSYTCSTATCIYSIITSPFLAPVLRFRSLNVLGELDN